MHALLRRAHLTQVDARPQLDWYRYLIVDEAEDLWVYSTTHEGLIRFNLINPVHWSRLFRSLWDQVVVDWSLDR